MVLAACGESRDTTAPKGESSPRVVACEGAVTPAPSESPKFEPVKILINTDGGSVLLDGEVAETAEEQAFGLMFRRSLPGDAGMVFVFFEPFSGGFYMKNTFIPLSIAYFDDKGVILKILDMEPCEEDSTLYDPGVPYSGALEVNQGAFAELGVKEGDRITLTR
jgi:uncharacterized membrane protein (UPF0127 family)